SFTMQHPEEDAFAEIFVTPLTATVSSTSSGGDAFNVHPFEVGLAVLDTDAESMSKNMVIVGGPCANTIAAEVMSNPADCAAGFEEGKAMVKYFTRSGKAALLVAGYSAKDTRGASYVLADYGKYGLEGDEVEVVSTNLADLKVNKV
ncbi:MAG: S-layer protein, partial [Candidatus Woesearchaeota archaeon]|nr:S-layer protein [Candidatus Woesearchaeota archaeon]